jgi:hypothetical protein
LRAEQEWVLHEAGYDYESMTALTYAEVRRLMEGKRVHEKVKQMARDTNRDDGAVLGRTVPRESDEQLLDDYADRMERGDAGQSTLGGG